MGTATVMAEEIEKIVVHRVVVHREVLRDIARVVYQRINEAFLSGDEHGSRPMATSEAYDALRAWKALDEICNSDIADSWENDEPGFDDTVSFWGEIDDHGGFFSGGEGELTVEEEVTHAHLVWKR